MTALGKAFEEMNYSEDQLRVMIDTIPTLAWSCRPDGTTEFLNQQWLDYTGLSQQEAVGWGWKTPIHPEDLGKLMRTWDGLIASGEPGEEEARLRRFDGEYRWFLFRVVPVRNEGGKVVRWYGTNTDIEDRKLAEARARQAESDLRLVIDTIPAMAWSALPDGSVDFLSQRWLEYYGLSLAEAKASGWTRLVHPEDLPGIVEKWRAAVASGEPYEHVVRARPAGGDYRWCLSRAVPLRDEGGNIVKWYGTTNDIEDRRRAESLSSGEKRS